MFKKNKLSQVIMVMAATAGSHQVMAQESTDALEEVTVTGIRASLERSMDIKRDSSGVVDAISAEDIGKFPDTNLAESLQRITGVSINRVNGEGAEVTARGFGPEFNMVTLNGRTMPGGTMYAGASGEGFQRTTASRAFNFANLASENVSGVEVYKTSKADIASGGIGATVNIKTAKPLDNPGFTASAGLKGVSDTTNRTGDDITPEFSSFVSMTNDAGTFGASLALSHQQRDSGYSGVTVNEWKVGVWGDDDLYGGALAESDIENVPEAGQLYARPTDFRYAFSDTTRERNNGQLTLQFAPSDRFEATVDYLYADNDIEEHRGEMTNWLQNGNGHSYDRVVFDDSAIATPVSITESYSGTVDIGFEQQYRSQSNTLKSLGLNLEFQVSDGLRLAFDAHDSSMESTPTGPDGAGELAMGLGAGVVTSKTLDYSSKTPSYSFNTTVPSNQLTVDHVGSSILRMVGSGSQNDVQQFKLDGQWELDNGGRFDFGVESRTVEMDAYTTSGFNQGFDQGLGGWGVNNPGEFSESGLLEVINVQSEFDDYNTGGSPVTAFRGDAVALTQYAIDNFADGACFCVADSNAAHNILEEETMAAYAQLEVSTELAGYPATFLAGARYEVTNVDSVSQVDPIPYLTWQSDNDFAPGPAGDKELAQAKSEYAHLLPNLDFSINLTEDVVGRFSYGKTIARPTYGDLAVSPSGFGTSGSTLLGAVPTANMPNPELVPMESTNLDFSVEWYYGDSSYASVGFFEKNIEKFIGSGQEEMTHFDIRDQTRGPRAQAAVTELEGLDLPVDNGTLHAMMVFMQNDPSELMAAADAWTAAEPGREHPFADGLVFDGSGEQVNWLSEFAPEHDVIAQSDDPAMTFLTSRPINQKEARINGLEFAVQHFFGDTGFGVQANYTIVRGDIEFDNLGLPSEQQFPLVGLSDTANLVLLYENYGLQARVAYNWRDDFLTGVNIQEANNPLYVADYSQIDLGVSYDFTDNLTVALEGINVTGEDGETYMRNERMIKTLDDLGPRWQLGAHYKF